MKMAIYELMSSHFLNRLYGLISGIFMFIIYPVFVISFLEEDSPERIVAYVAWLIYFINMTRYGRIRNKIEEEKKAKSIENAEKLENEVYSFEVEKDIYDINSIQELLLVDRRQYGDMYNKMKHQILSIAYILGYPTNTKKWTGIKALLIFDSRSGHNLKHTYLYKILKNQILNKEELVIPFEVETDFDEYIKRGLSDDETQLNTDLETNPNLS